MAASQKKVILRLFSGATTAGYLAASGFGGSGTVDVLDVAGRTLTFAMSDVKHIAFVREFDQQTKDPEQLERAFFAARPRTHGLWVRLTLRDATTFEGMLASDLVLLDSLIRDTGLFLTPPDARSNTQRLFVPRSSLTSFQVLGAIGCPVQRRPAAIRTDPQPNLFGDA